MRLPVTGLLVLTLTLGACGKIRDSRLNPFNWFGRSEVVEVPAEGVVPGRPYDTRILVSQVIDMEVARYPGGAIVRATGLPPTQGWWKADLVAENSGFPVDGVLTYRFVIAEPLTPKPVSTQQSREVTAATHLSNVKLADVRQIVVVGAQNSRASRR
jgi:hypothetical protein